MLSVDVSIAIVRVGAEGAANGAAWRVQPLGPLTVPTGQAGYLLDDGAAGAPRVPAGESADPQLKNNASSGDGQISGKPQVGTMNPVRPDPARRAREGRRPGAIPCSG